MNKITAIIATHNNKTNIVRALDSLINNTRKPDHIIVGDNESTDNTYEELCKILNANKVQVGDKSGWTPKFTGEYKGIPTTIFRKRKSTTANTLNIAIQTTLPDTQFYTFLNPNDWYESDKISQSIEVFEKNNRVVCVVTDCINHLSDGRKIIDFKPSYDIDQIHYDYRYDENFMVSINTFKRLGGFFNDNLEIMHDYELMLRMTRLGLIYHISKPLYNHPVKDGFTEHDHKVEQMQKQLSQLSLSGRTVYG